MSLRRSALRERLRWAAHQRDECVLSGSCSGIKPQGTLARPVPIEDVCTLSGIPRGPGGGCSERGREEREGGEEQEREGWEEGGAERRRQREVGGEREGGEDEREESVLKAWEERGEKDGSVEEK